MLKPLGRFRGLLAGIAGDDLARHSAIMTLAAVAAGLLNYVYQLVMGLMLPQVEYGTLFSLLSLSMVVTTFSQTFQNAASRYTSTLRVRGSVGQMKTLWLSLLWRSLALGLAAFIILAALTPVVSSYLKLEDDWLFVLLSGSFVLAFALSVNQGLMQGLQRFLPLGVCQLLLPLTKILLGVVLVALGLGVYGALFPLIAGGAVLFVVTLFLLRNVVRARAEPFKSGGLGSYTGLTLLAVASFGLLTNVDVVMAKHYLSPERAGDYAAMAVMGRMALYAPSGIGAAMFPKTAELFDSGVDPHRAMRRAVLYVLATGAVILVGYCFLHGFIIDFAFKGEYSFAVVDLVKYGLAMLLLSLTFLIMNYFLSVNQTAVAYAAGVVALLNVVLLAVFHSDIGSFVNVMVVCGAVSVALMLPFYIRDRRRYRS